jgi:FMN phosphatase YigB (HAD superfamily)
MMQTIVWDVDDVLNDLMRAWFTQAWKPAHPECRISYRDLRENPPHRILGVEPCEYLDSLDAFRLSPQARSLEPNPAVLAWLRQYGDRYRHVALTARPLESAPAAAEWLFRHFGGHFRCFGVVPSRSPAGTPHYDGQKAEFLQWLGGADYFIDDSEENVAAARRLEIPSVLYPQPWNRATFTVDDALATLIERMVAN